MNRDANYRLQQLLKEYTLEQIVDFAEKAIKQQVLCKCGRERVPDTTLCPHCTEIHRRNSRNYYHRHKEKVKAYNKEWNLRNRDKVNAYARKRYKKKKKKRETK